MWLTKDVLTLLEWATGNDGWTKRDLQRAGPQAWRGLNKNTLDDRIKKMLAAGILKRDGTYRTPGEMGNQAVYLTNWLVTPRKASPNDQLGRAA